MKKMGNAIWLFLLFLDWITEECNGIGKVLGGSPITYEKIRKRLGISARQYARYLKDLQKGNYVVINRTPYGLVVEIPRSKKFKRSQTDMPHLADQNKRDMPNLSKRYATSGRSDMPHPADQGTKNGRSNKDTTVDITEDTTVDNRDIGQYGEIRKLVIAFYDLQYKKFPRQLRNYEKDREKLIADSISEIDKLIRIDGYTFTEVRRALEIAVKDDFWSDKIISLRGLRKKSKQNDLSKFDNLYSQVKNGISEKLAGIGEWLAEEELKQHEIS